MCSWPAQHNRWVFALTKPIFEYVPNIFYNSFSSCKVALPLPKKQSQLMIKIINGEHRGRDVSRAAPCGLFQLQLTYLERPLPSAYPQVLVATPSQWCSSKSVAVKTSWVRCEGQAWWGTGVATTVFVLSSSIPAVAISNSCLMLAAVKGELNLSTICSPTKYTSEIC